MIPSDSRDMARENRKKDVVLDEIKEELLKRYPKTTQSDKTAKAELLDQLFGTRSWERVKTFPRSVLEEKFQLLSKMSDVSLV